MKDKHLQQRKEAAIRMAKEMWKDAEPKLHAYYDGKFYFELANPAPGADDSALRVAVLDADLDFE